MSGEVIYRQLPAGPAPKALTARAPTPNLREHFLAFLAKNNPGGFEHPPSEAETTFLLGFVAIAQALPHMSKKQVSEMGKAIRQKLDNPSINTNQCYEIVAQMAGYASYRDFTDALKLTNDGWVTRVRPFNYLGEITDAAELTEEALGDIRVFQGGKAKKLDAMLQAKGRGQTLCAMLKRGDLAGLLKEAEGKRLEPIFQTLTATPVGDTIPLNQLRNAGRYLWKRLDIDRRTGSDLVAILIGYENFNEILTTVLPESTRVPVRRQHKLP